MQREIDTIKDGLDEEVKRNNALEEEMLETEAKVKLVLANHKVRGLGGGGGEGVGGDAWPLMVVVVVVVVVLVVLVVVLVVVLLVVVAWLPVRKWCVVACFHHRHTTMSMTFLLFPGRHSSCTSRSPRATATSASS